MGKNKAPRPNGMVVEFYTFQNLIGIDYFQIIEVTVKDGGFPNGVDKRLITMLFKARDKEISTIGT
jgi:hypothetical protein